MKQTLPPLSQKWFDNNRQRFGAETASIDLEELKKNKCHHKFRRISPIAFECTLCHNQWVDMGKIKLPD